MSSFPQELNTTNIPKHIAVIMDGNGRWAKQRGQNRLEGHAMGVESVRATLKTARELGVSFLTLYAFLLKIGTVPKRKLMD